MENIKLKILKQAAILLCCFIGLPVSIAQEVKENYELSTAMQGSKLYEATNSVKLKQGFSYSAQENSDVFIGRTVRDLNMPETRKVMTHSFLPFKNTFDSVFTTKISHSDFRGKYDVSDMGIFQYAIPIDLPAESNKLSPELSINYLGLDVTGNIAQSWSLSGMKSVKRVKKNKDLDGHIEGIQWNEHDALNLNGCRLYLCPLGRDYTSTDTLRECYIKEDRSVRIFAHGWGSLGPQWFEVWYPDGAKEVYGKWIDSREVIFKKDVVYVNKDDGSRTVEEVKSPVYGWHINYKEDKYGNRMVYEYDNVNYEYEENFLYNLDFYRHTHYTDSVSHRYCVLKNTNDNIAYEVISYVNKYMFLRRINYGVYTADNGYDKSVELFWSENAIKNPLRFFGDNIKKKRRLYLIDSIGVSSQSNSLDKYYFVKYDVALKAVVKGKSKYELEPYITFGYDGGALEVTYSEDDISEEYYCPNHSEPVGISLYDFEQVYGSSLSNALSLATSYAITEQHCSYVKYRLPTGNEVYSSTGFGIPSVGGEQVLYVTASYDNYHVYASFSNGDNIDFHYEPESSYTYSAICGGKAMELSRAEGSSVLYVYPSYSSFYDCAVYYYSTGEKGGFISESDRLPLKSVGDSDATYLKEHFISLSDYGPSIDSVRVYNLLQSMPDSNGVFLQDTFKIEYFNATEGWQTQYIGPEEFNRRDNNIRACNACQISTINHTPDESVELCWSEYILDYDEELGRFVVVADGADFSGSATIKADFNGDGLTDIYTFSRDYYAGAYGGLYIATGSGYEEFSTINVDDAPRQDYNDEDVWYYDAKLFPTDVNNDGMCDIVVLNKYAGTAKVYISTGTSFILTFSDHAKNAYGQHESRFDYVFVEEDDGDLVMSFLSTAKKKSEIRLVDGVRNSRLTSISENNTGGFESRNPRTVNIEYARAIDIESGQMKEPNRVSTGHAIMDKLSIAQVDKVITDDYELQMSYGEQFDMWNGMKGTKGFDKVVFDKVAGGVHTTTTKTFVPMQKQSNVKSYVCKPLTVEVTVGTSEYLHLNPTTSYTAYLYDTLSCQYPEGNVKYCHLPHQKEVYNVLNGSAIVERYQYDNYFNPIEKQSTYHTGYEYPEIEIGVPNKYYTIDSKMDLNSFEKKTIEKINYEYYLDDDNWLPGRPTSKTTALALADGSSYTDSVRYNYQANDNSRHLDVMTKVTFEGTENETHSTVHYDTYGNPETETISFVSDPHLPVPDRTLTTSRAFSEDGGRLISETNPLGFTQKFTYNDYGQLLSSSDYNGLLTAYKYDNLQRQIGTTMPDGTRSISSTSFIPADSMQHIYIPHGMKDTTGLSCEASYCSYTANSATLPVVAYYNIKDQKIREISYSQLGKKMYKDYAYDEAGRLIREYLPYFAFNTRDESLCITYQYDDFGRLLCTINPDSTFVQHIYDADITTTQSGKVLNGAKSILHTTSTKTNAYGLKEYEVDSEGDTVRFVYDPRGLLVETYVEGQADATRNVYAYNRMGLRTKMKNNAADTAYFAYNSMGKLVSVIDPLQNETHYTYDKVGRVLSYTINDASAQQQLAVDYLYDADKKGLLSQEVAGGHIKTYAYDDLCRLSEYTEQFPETSDTDHRSYEYDQYSRPVKEMMEGYGVSLENKYDPNTGALVETGANYGAGFVSTWQATDEDELGNITLWNTGNGNIEVQKDVNQETGNIDYIDYDYNGNSIYNISYDYYTDRNFAARHHTYNGQTHSEYYAFDQMNQLIYSGASQTIADSLHWGNYQYTNLAQQTTQYDALGQKTQIQNITGLSMAVAYDQDGHIANPDQLSTNDPLMFAEQEIKYNHFNRVESFRLDNNELKFDYRPDASKWRTRYYEDDVLQYTKYHRGTHEKVVYADGTTKNLFYIFGDKDLAGICVKVGSNTQMTYAITDHLGSIWALANEQGQLVEKYAYDPWGKRINPDDWSQNDERTEFITDRGFTMHEHFDAMQIIYMNARLYDPLLGQFISVDPLADMYPGLGAYVYCANNPLRYIDPTGMSFLSDIGDWFSDLWYDIEDIIDQIEDAISQIEDAIAAIADSFNDILEEAFDDLWDTSEWGLTGVIEQGSYVYKDASIMPDIEINQELVQSQVTQEVLSTRVESGEDKKLSVYDYPNGSYLFSNKVSVSFDANANNMVNPSLAAYFNKTMQEAYKVGVRSVNISCTTYHPSNASRSAHTIKNGARALDINYINGVHVSKTNSYVEKLQNVIKSSPGYLENYGPSIINKVHNGTVIDAPWARNIKGGHYDHIHLSMPKN